MNSVIFEADSDAVTSRVHAARRKVLSASMGRPQVDLFGAKALSAEVRTAHKALQGIDMFSGMGHGGPDEFCGQFSFLIYESADTIKTNYTTQKTIVHLYSCDCAKALGPMLVKRGAKAFIGYDQPVVIPGNQSVVEEFVRVPAVIDHSIASGDGQAATKRKLDAEAVAVEKSLRASPVATPRNLAEFRRNQAALTGPWSNPALGSY